MAAALVDKALESSNHSSVNEKDMNAPPNSPRGVFVGAETSPIGDDDSVECDFSAVEEKLQIMKKIILTTRANLMRKIPKRRAATRANAKRSRRLA